MTNNNNWLTNAVHRNDWRGQVVEEIIDPDRTIVDPHHHLWPRQGAVYELAELWADTETGHNIAETVYIECRSSYDLSAPEHLQPVGETRYVVQIAKAARAHPGRAQINGIVAFADLRNDRLAEILDAHEEAGAGRFKGIRHAGARDPEPAMLAIPGRGFEGQYRDAAFQNGVAALGARGLTYDTWHYHHQNRDFAALAAAVPDTTLVLDHFGTPLGVGRFADKRAEIFKVWKDDVAEIARFPNVVAKLGGLAMPDNGWKWHENASPPSSDAYVAAYRDWYRHMIDCFGPERCMFESNFPVDRISISYPVLWNAFKKIAAEYSEAEQSDMFCGTARRIYRL